MSAPYALANRLKLQRIRTDLCRCTATFWRSSKRLANSPIDDRNLKALKPNNQTLTDRLFRSTGYDRNVPGFPRYSIFGDEKDGVHNLRIENARLEDDGEFQCQVSALDSRWIRWTLNFKYLWVEKVFVGLQVSPKSGIRSVRQADGHP